MHQITVGDFVVDVVRKDIKNMHLAVYPPSGRVRIAAPLSVDDEAVRLFAITKLPWIKLQYRNFINQDRSTPREYIERESHYFLGKRYLLRIIESEEAAKVVLKGRRYIDLHIKIQSSISTRKTVFEKWYRSEMKLIIAELIKKWEPIMGVTVLDFEIRSMKRKWGSCNIEAQKILLNLQLAKKPQPCIEYIVVHEMVHLLERNHNERFINYLNHFLPNWKELKSELNQLAI